MKPRPPRSRTNHAKLHVLISPCPYCGPRPELEFGYGGEAHIARPGPNDAVTPEQWAAFQYQRTNTQGPHAERWRHSRGCGRFFNVVRDTTTDQISHSYRIGEARPDVKSGANVGVNGGVR